MLDMLEFLRDEGISPDIIAEVEKFRDAYPTADPALLRRVPDPRYLYYGVVYGPNIPIFEGGELAGWRSPKGKKKHPTGRKLTYQGAPERGAFWFERMLPEHRDDIVQEAAAAAGGRPGR